MASRGRVLVLDGDRASALDIVRSLGRAGAAVDVGAPRPKAIGFASRFASGCVVYPDPARDAEAFVDWLEEAIRAGRYDLVMPVTDVTMMPVSRHLARLRPHAAIAAPPPEQLRLVNDKQETLALARTLGVPCPATTIVRTARDLERVAGELSYPVVCKPCASSVWGSEGYVGLSVFYALDARELLADVGGQLARSPVLLQEYRRGSGVGIEVLARDGEILQAFQHQRLHELPLTGGGSTYRVSVAVEPRLREYASRLIAALRWTGVAMVEFKVDARGAAWLMEINGRFWGSLPLSSRAGMAFAADLYDMLARGVTPPARTYATGVRCRKLHDDLEWFKAVWALDRRHRFVAAGLIDKPSTAALLGDALRLLSPWDRYDVQLLSDPVPGLVDMRGVVQAQLGTVRRRLGRLFTAPRSAWYRLRHHGRLAVRARSARRLLFVCYGNIMRSPFASAYLAAKTAGGAGTMAALSAGLHPRTGRPADGRAVAAGRRWGVDLSTHVSAEVDGELVAWADLILVMDRPNLAAVTRRFPAAADKTFLLGCFDAPVAPDVEIPDPFAHSYDATERAYGRIAQAVDRLVTHAAAPRR